MGLFADGYGIRPWVIAVAAALGLCMLITGLVLLIGPNGGCAKDWHPVVVSWIPVATKYGTTMVPVMACEANR